MSMVKICGITNTGEALYAQDKGADFIGFVFAKSPRRVTPSQAAYIISRLSLRVKTVGVFVDEKKERVKEIIKKSGRIDCLQFHGEESPKYCGQFPGKKVIKAFRIKDEDSLKGIKDFDNVDYILLDGFSMRLHGGTGKGFNLDLAVKAKDFGLPVFLSGGLNPDNVRAAIEKVKPFCVDVSSGVEKLPGEKDPDLIAKFINAVKA